jgi:polysaccharide export outer membrane protein
MVLRAFALVVASALALSGCASSRTVHIQSSAAPPSAAAAADTAAAQADDALLPQDPMSEESDTPIAADIVNDPPAEEYVQVASALPTAKADGETYRIDTGDRVRVFVYGQPNLTRIYPVDGQGFIAMPLIGSVKARGLSTEELGSNITALLGTDYVRNPEVAVEVVSYRPVNVIGEVRNAGQFGYQPGMTVETAVAVAGGYSPRANQSAFSITRTVDGVPAEIDASPYDEVRPGDTVRVLERYF